VFHLSPQSKNSKTGPIAVTTSSKSTCPVACPWKGAGCYAEIGRLDIHWRNVTKGKHGTDLDTHTLELQALPPQQKLRLHQAGDLPGNGITLAKEATRKLLRAAGWKRKAWTYTHYLDSKSLRFLATVRKSDYCVVNLSADSPGQADRFFKRGFPVTCVVPSMRKVQVTPGGHRIVLCPAQSIRGVNCDNCGRGAPLCWRKDRSYVIGFYPHGSRKGRMLEVLK
jgi:hypothetical protein